MGIESLQEFIFLGWIERIYEPHGKKQQEQESEDASNNPVDCEALSSGQGPDDWWRSAHRSIVEQ
jgi:hypothetical protein